MYIAYSGFSPCRSFENTQSHGKNSIEKIKGAPGSQSEHQLYCKNTNRRPTVNSITINTGKILNERLVSRSCINAKLDEISMANPFLSKTSG